MVRPPPGVGSAASRPPIASVNPLATARPSPMPAAWVASSRRWNGRNMSTTRSAGMPRPWSMMRSSPAGRPLSVAGLSPPAVPATTMSESVRVLDRVLDDVRDDALQHALVGIDLGHVGRKLHPHPARRDAVQCAGDDLVPAEGMEPGADRVGSEAGHVQQVADQHIEPVGAFLDRGQQLLLFLRRISGPGLPEAADGELDPGQRRPEIVGDRAEDGRAHGVALGQAHHFPPAGYSCCRSSWAARCTPKAARSRRSLAGRIRP